MLHRYQRLMLFLLSRRYTLDNPAGAQPSWLDPDLQPMALGRKTNDWLMG
eukprot:CAMPEP_0203887154 /NCGR_PEP_ID=MMETSP0359-20131031/30886_1 /ASSEMBLY_ACC=CAM_ASM_000338 /TAXON_ID=268821 /ORGANISM="Scrippsiella Hangoei, Strain SHTV-5" /LENGTH=49 /DNA_ID= /DNA_START= /DNA_END= /DNA_ORIENTATION=